jgi:hypothetical protein
MGGRGGAGGQAGVGGDGGTGGTGGEGGAAGIRADFETSLHKTRAGLEFWYARKNGGIDSLIRTPYANFLCRQCHNPEDASWANTSTCEDCHEAGSDPPKQLQSVTCLGCHARQRAEAMAIDDRDVHASTSTCASCHRSNDVHGNGTVYDSMLRPGAIATRCTDCHGQGVEGAKDPPSDAYHAAQHDAVDCALCHTEAVLSCINCHLEDELVSQEKCESVRISDWKFVMKWDKDGGGNEVYSPATLTTIKYNCDVEQNPSPCDEQAFDPKKTFAVFAPYYAHTVTQQAMDEILSTPGDPSAPAPGSSDGCAYCHSAENCEAILSAGDPKLKLIAFDGKTLVNPMKGLIPLPADFRDRFEIDYVEWAEGPGSGCQTAPGDLVLFEVGPDLWQTGEDTSPPNKSELGRSLTAAEFQIYCPPAD